MNWKKWPNKGVAVPRALVGTRVRNPLKILVMCLSLLVNCYLEIKFHNKQKTGWTHPPPPPPPPFMQFSITIIILLCIITALASASAFLAAVGQIGQLALIGLLFRQLTSRLSEYSPKYPHLIFGIPRIIKTVSLDFLIPTSKLASIVIRNNNKNPKMAIFKSIGKGFFWNPHFQTIIVVIYLSRRWQAPGAV